MELKVKEIEKIIEKKDDLVIPLFTENEINYVNDDYKTNFLTFKEAVKILKKYGGKAQMYYIKIIKTYFLCRFE